jgi:hypothetical protein
MHIIVSGQTIGCDAYRGTAEEAEFVRIALIDFGFLIKDGTMATRRVSFGRLADQIEAHSVDPRVPEIVAALRSVNERNQ